MRLLSMLTRRKSRQDAARNTRLVELVQKMDRSATAGAGEELSVSRAELREYLASLADDAEPETMKLYAMGNFDLASSLRETGDFQEAESRYRMVQGALSTLAKDTHN